MYMEKKRQSFWKTWENKSRETSEVLCLEECLMWLYPNKRGKGHKIIWNKMLPPYYKFIWSLHIICYSQQYLLAREILCLQVFTKCRTLHSESVVHVFSSTVWVVWWVSRSCLAVWCLLIAWRRMVNQDYNEFPRDGMQSRKNSQQKCLQANKNVSVTSHFLGVYMSSIFVTEVFAHKEY